MSAGERKAVKVALMRGGTSRGPVLLADSLPTELTARDACVARFVDSGPVQTDGVGGGSPPNSKLVVVRPVRDDRGLLLEYAVGNIVIGRDAVDWSGTCGNMTATVPLYALEEGLVAPSFEGPIRLLNTSTGGRIDTLIADMPAHRRGEQATVTTRYLEPTGSVLGALLPTGAGTDEIRVDGVPYRVSVVDVTHPYLFAYHDEVVGPDSLEDPRVLERIERIRGEACLRLGLVSAAQDATRLSPSVPRVVLLHRAQTAEGGLRISAVSMGMAIVTVPVTAAMCLAAAVQLRSTLPGGLPGVAAGSGALTVVAAGARMRAAAQLDSTGRIVYAAVERTARTILQGTAWI